jgi:predicted branched-subunit amino acid permease
MSVRPDNLDLGDVPEDESATNPYQPSQLAPFSSLSPPFERSELYEGLRASVPVIIASSPFGLLFGAKAVEQGMSVSEATLMSAAVYGGASQMVGLDLFGERVAPWLIVLSIFAVNFRHVLYSAAVGQRIAHWPSLERMLAFFFLVDPQYAESERRALSGRTLTFTWYMGMALPVYTLWIISAAIGGIFGELITNPEAIGLDYLLPIYFLSLVMGFRKRPLWLPLVIVSGGTALLAVKLVGSPWHVSIGAAAGVLFAALIPPKQEVEVQGPEAPA